MNTTTNTNTNTTGANKVPRPSRPKRGGGRRWTESYRWVDSRQQVALLATIGRPFA